MMAEALLRTLGFFKPFAEAWRSFLRLRDSFFFRVWAICAKSIVSSWYQQSDEQ